MSSFIPNIFDQSSSSWRQIFKNGHDDLDRVGIIMTNRSSNSIKLDMIPSLLVLLEEFIIVATILHLSRRTDKSDRRIWGSKLSDLGDVRFVNSAHSLAHS